MVGMTHHRARDDGDGREHGITKSYDAIARPCIHAVITAFSFIGLNLDYEENLVSIVARFTQALGNIPRPPS